MRAFVFLLVAANLVFFAWANGYFGESTNPDAIRLQQQLAADKLHVLAKEEPPPLPKAPERKPPAERCVAWDGLAAADADSIDAALAEQFAALRRERHTLPEVASWWVFIPPQPNKAEAEKKAGELKRLGVPEYYVVQDAGPNRWAISLGIFSSEQASKERLEAVRGKGVKTARQARRGVSRPEQIVVEVTGPEAMTEAAREAVARSWPDAKPTACGKR